MGILNLEFWAQFCDGDRRNMKLPLFHISAQKSNFRWHHWHKSKHYGHRVQSTVQSALCYQSAFTYAHMPPLKLEFLLFIPKIWAQSVILLLLHFKACISKMGHLHTIYHFFFFLKHMYIIADLCIHSHHVRVTLARGQSHSSMWVPTNRSFTNLHIKMEQGLNEKTYPLLHSLLSLNFAHFFGRLWGIVWQRARKRTPAYHTTYYILHSVGKWNLDKWLLCTTSSIFSRTARSRALIFNHSFFQY